MTQRIGLIGAGLMGHAIGKNLLEKGYGLAVLGHRNRTPVEDLLGRGAVEVASAGELARSCQAIFISVTAAPQVEQLVYGDGGILAECRPGLVVIDCTTSEPALSRRVHASLKARGADFADAPLSRTPAQAEAGQANTMVGASEETLAAIRPWLSTFCENIHHVGPVGAGHTIKLIYNYFAMGQVALIAEALAACAATGIDLRTYHGIVSASAGNSATFQHVVGKVLAGDLGGLAFSLANAEKDVRYFRHMADAIPLNAPVSSMVHHAFVQALNLGLKDAPVGAVVEAQEKLHGLKIVPR